LPSSNAHRLRGADLDYRSLPAVLLTGDVAIPKTFPDTCKVAAKMLEMEERIRRLRDKHLALLAAAACGLILAMMGCSRSSETDATAAVPPSTGSTYTLMQMNLCLSGLARCYGKVDYPDP
jgi:hypothetical protein